MKLLSGLTSTLLLLATMSAQAFPTFPSTHTVFFDVEAETERYERRLGMRLGFYHKGVAVFEISEARRKAQQGQKIYLNFYLSWDWDDFDFPLHVYVFPGRNALNDKFAWNATQPPPPDATHFFGPYGWEVLVIDGVAHHQKFEARAAECTFEFRDKYPYSACHFEPYSVDITSWVLDPRITDDAAGLSSPFMGVLFEMPSTDDGIMSMIHLEFSEQFDDYGLLKAGLNLNTVPLQRMALPSDVLTCNGKEATVLGTFNDDQLILTGTDEVVVTFDGADRITGSATNDTICPGDGNNVVYGGDGDDWIQGGRLSESLFGGPGNDVIRGGAGSNIMVGAGGHDQLFGEDGSQNVLRGGSGDDVLQAGSTSMCFGDSGMDQASSTCGVREGIEATLP